MYALKKSNLETSYDYRVNLEILKHNKEYQIKRGIIRRIELPLTKNKEKERENKERKDNKCRTHVQRRTYTDDRNSLTWEPKNKR